MKKEYVRTEKESKATKTEKIQVNGEVFTLNPTAMNMGKPNRRSWALKALGDKETKAVLIVPKLDAGRDNSPRTNPATKLLGLANDLEISEIPQILDAGTINYDPFDQIFNTGSNTNNRPYILVEDVSEHAFPVLYDNLPVKKQVSYSLLELNVVIDMLNTMSLAYKDFDDEVWLHEDEPYSPTVKIIDFSEEKTLGNPITAETAVHLARQLHNKDSVNPNELDRIKNIIFKNANMLKKHNLLEPKYFDALKYITDKKIRNEYLKKLKLLHKLYSQKVNFPFYQKILNKTSETVRRYEENVDICLDSVNTIEMRCLDSSMLFFDRRINPILKKLGIIDVKKVLEVILRNPANINKLITNKNAKNFLLERFDGYDKKKIMVNALLFLLSTNSSILQKRNPPHDNQEKKLTRISQGSNIIRIQTMLGLTLISIEEYILEQRIK